MSRVSAGALLYALAVCGVLAPFLGHQGFWVDEGTSWVLATAKDFTELLSFFEKWKTSEVQMPGFVFFVFGWGRVFGGSEAIFRLSNLIWLLPLLVLWYAWGKRLFVGDKIGMAIWLGTLTVSPFVIAYVYDFRPYVAIIALGAVVSYLLVNGDFHKASHRFSLLAACFLASTYSMLAGILTVVALAEVVRTNKEGIVPLVRRWRAQVAVFFVPFAVLLGYFVWTLRGGSGGFRERPSFKNVAFAFYEFLGFGGLGPNKDQMHENPNVGLFLDFTGYLLPMAAVLGLIFAGALLSRIGGRRHARDPRDDKALVSLAFQISLAFVICYVGSYLAGFRFVGRHLTFSFIPILVLVNLGLRSINGKPLARVLGILLLGGWLLSTVRITFLPFYGKDDYRSAAAIIRANLGDTAEVMLTGNCHTWLYYGLTCELPAEGGRAAIRDANFLEPTTVQPDPTYGILPGKVLVALTRPYIFDPHGIVAAMVDRDDAELLATKPLFKVYSFVRE